MAHLSLSASPVFKGASGKRGRDGGKFAMRCLGIVQNCSRILIRSSVLGWVAKSPLRNCIRPCDSCLGWMIYICAMSSRSTSQRPGLAEILRRAEARACGLPQSSAPPASAMNSRLREMAKRVSMMKR